jgi:hypothetical protein
MKNKLLYAALFTIGGIVVLAAGAISYVKFALPDVGPPPQIVIERTTERVARGKYLAHHVMVCMDCHSARDWSKFSGPLVAGTEGRGGEVFDQTVGLPGRYVSSNITPANLSTWSDGEVFRAITSGVGKDGRALFPIMPHPNFGQMDREDIYAVIAYIRTLKPIEYRTEPSKSDFPMSLIIHTIPQKPSLPSRPAFGDTLAYGKYLVTAASCSDCHTNYVDGRIVGELYAGGREFPMPDGSLLRSPNITPHATGIGSWTAEQFVARFKTYSDTAHTHALPTVAKGEFQTIMPWTMYADMTEQDLRAIYTYMRSVKPAQNQVESFVAMGAKK